MNRFLGCMNFELMNIVSNTIETVVQNILGSYIFERYNFESAVIIMVSICEKNELKMI